MVKACCASMIRHVSDGDRDWEQTWNPHVPMATRPRVKGERLWTLRKDGHELVAGLIGRGEYGWVQLRAAADRFSAERRAEYERDGWQA